jgi:hypothetical protein
MNPDSQSGARFRDEFPEPICSPITSGLLGSTSARMRRCHALGRVLDLNLVSLAHLAAVDRHVDLVPGVERSLVLVSGYK